MKHTKENGRQQAPENQSTISTEEAVLAAGVLGSAEEKRPERSESEDSRYILDLVFYGPSEYRL